MMKNIYEMLQDVCSRNKDGIFFVRQNETYAELLKKAASAVDELCKKDAGKAQEILDVVSKERFFEDKSHII